MKKNKRLRCVVGKETERMLALGHPWVIADRFTAKWPKGESGDLISLVNEQGALLGTALLDPQARIIARLLSRQAINIDRVWLGQRFQQADELRQWINLGETTVWRMVNAEGDGLPGLSVDRYGDFFLVQYFTEAWLPHLSEVVEALMERHAPKGVYAKFRPQQTRKLEVKHNAKGTLSRGEAAPDGYTVKENGLSYRVDLVHDMHTGLFLDQRANRREFQCLAAGREVLNLFAYTGAFSVAAAAGGALCTTSVDVAGRYLKWAQENFRLNGIDPNAHEFITGDCFAKLDRLADAGRSFDLVLMDPPSFSTTRKSRFTTSGGTADLVQKVLRLMPPGALLITSSNLQKMALADYLKELRKGSLAGGRTLRVIDVGGQGADFPFPPAFPEGQYLKYVTSVVQDELGVE